MAEGGGAVRVSAAKLWLEEEWNGGRSAALDPDAGKLLPSREKVLRGLSELRAGRGAQKRSSSSSSPPEVILHCLQMN